MYDEYAYDEDLFEIPSNIAEAYAEYCEDLTSEFYGECNDDQ